MQVRWRDELKARWGELRLTVVWGIGAVGRVPGARRLYRAVLRRLVRGTQLFDPAYYIDSNEDLDGATVRALSHYVTFGDREGRQPMALFDPLHYSAHAPGRLKRINSLLHFAWVGVHRRISPSAWFDVEFYLSQNRDVARAGMNPLLHYWKYGGTEGRAPSPLFDGAYYLRTNPDVERARVNPLIHYLRIGRLERREIAPEQDCRVAGKPEAHLLPEDFAWQDLAGRGDCLRAQVDVIVPVYKGLVETLLCLFSVLTARSSVDFELVVVNDASPDAALAEKLRELATLGLLTLVENEENRGFVGTVNRGMALHPGRDVVLLNSDTQVYDGWIDRLRAAAVRNERTGTVTPLSNNATICSYPRFLHDNPFPLEISYAELDRVASEINAGVEVETPTAVGFCMYIRRDCLVQTGGFDEETFGKGYGEENDFCMRAAKRGWRHVVAADVFVRHWGATSFAGEKPARMAAAERKLSRLHPSYHEQVARFVKQDPLADARTCLDWARLRRLSHERNVLVVCHGRGGGTERRVQEEIQRLSGSGCGVFLLRPDLGQQGFVSLRHATAKSLPNLYALEFADVTRIRDRLKELRITEIHLHSLVDFPSGAPQVLRTVVDLLDARLEVFLHDYALICPRINLATDDGWYCGEPDAATCDKCVKERRAAGDPPGIASWRGMYGQLLEVAARVVVPDGDMAVRLSKYFPNIAFTVVPHEPPISQATENAPPPVLPGERIRVVVIGAISRLKGFEPLLQCARHARAFDQAIEFIVMGYSANDRQLEEAGVTVTGKYRDEEAVETLLGLRPHLVWLPSLWPETYCYTLSIALQAGIPVVAFDLGAIASRLSRIGPPHTLLPLAMSRAPEELNRCFSSYRYEIRSEVMKKEVRKTFHYADGVAPYFCHKDNRYYRIQGLEKSVIGSRNLLYASNVESGKTFGASGLQLERGEWLGAGTFRNSLYVEPLAQLTQIRDLFLYVDYEGVARIKLMCAVRGKPAEVLADVTLLSEQRTGYLHSVASPTDLPEACRLFWHVDAMEGGATIHEITFCTSSPPRHDCRLAVMLRTFGRSTEIRAILKRFVDSASADPYYASILDNVNFWVLDTSADAAGEYQEPWLEQLNLRVFTGPNLGGGGNAGHMLKLFDDACREAANAPTELLILDDDLSISMESLARYYMFCAYRAQDVICSLPILMKSRPTVVWEDGGFWGRLNFHEKGDFGNKRNLFPNLLKHSMSLSGYDRLDEFGPLNTCEYSTFIFYGMSMKTFRKVGYPAPFFLRGDDIELSLRAHELGVPMITNPNLAAWHEPAHSYGQEYMAILHGIIINFTYSDQGAEFYARYFEERFHEHSSINDMAGLKLYLSILKEVLNPESLVLTKRFQGHYLSMLKEWSAVRMLKLPDADREAFERSARDNKVLLVPFVYPGYHKDTAKYKSVVVMNHSAKAYREVPPCTAAERGLLGTQYMGMVADLCERFDEVRGMWQERLAQASGDAYWRGVRDMYLGETNEIGAWSRPESNTAAPIVRSAVTELVATKEARAWWRKLKRSTRGLERVDLADDEVRTALKSLAEFVQQRPGKGGRAGGRVRLLEEGQEQRTGVVVALPADFDPAVYLALNADVAEAGVNPAEHYLQSGIREGRKYRV